MFKKATFKLTALYLAILMLISLSFSFSLYQISIREINHGIKMQNDIYRSGPRFQILFDDPNELFNRQKDTVAASKNRLLANLFFINLGILIAGGFLSYYLARRTLYPIEEAHFAQVRFAADASHELRTPIAAMQTETEVALMDPNLNIKSAKKQLTSNLEELAKLTLLSESLLKLARLENGSLDKKQVNLSEITEAAIERVKERAKSKSITIETNLKPVKVTADESSLTEALVIVLDNAIKYSSNKSEISVKTSGGKDFVKISVKDNGIGISKKDLPHIFERFYRADTARNKENAEGYGLGLAIAKNIIDLHKGIIEAKSQPGQGTTITIEIPKDA